MGVRSTSVRHGWPLAAVAVVVAALVGLRLRLVHRLPSVDEAGYLAVARQWTGRGPQVYTHYFLDRPPLLVGLLRLADTWDGLTGLRVLGVLSAVVAALAASLAAGRVAGRVPALVAALVTAAFLASPALDAQEVNGELLAAPWIALGIAATVVALTSTGRRALLGGGAAGAAGVAALLIKQDMADVLVFLVAAVLAGRRLIGTRRALSLVGSAAVGGLLAGVAVLAWARGRGSSPGQLLFASYGFRLRAAAVLADRAGYGEHAGGLVRALLHSGLVVAVVVALAAVVVARRRREPAEVVLVALGATLVFDAAAVLSGQQYWTHYLVQLVVPAGVAVAVLSARRAWPAVLVAAASVVGCAVATVDLTQVSPAVALDHRVGRAIAHVSHPGDSVVAFPGHGDLTYASGLPSPYPYLWRLQSETLDPRLARLTSLLQGSAAPTWVVDFPNLGLDAPQRTRLHTDLDDHYTLVGRYGDAHLYRLDGLARPAPPGRAGTRPG